MWKRDEGSADTSTSRKARGSPDRSGAAEAGGRATIGPSITVEGEVTGDEDLVIQGRVSGSVNLGRHAVTIGPDGQVTADVVGRVISVEGSVEGDLTAEEQIVLRSSARVHGDIQAPRVVLEDGASFRGGVDMSGGENASRQTGASSSAKVESRSTSAASTKDGKAGSTDQDGEAAKAEGKARDTSGSNK